MILGDVEEVITTVEIDDETYEEIVRVRVFSDSIRFMLILWVIEGDLDGFISQAKDIGREQV